MVKEGPGNKWLLIEEGLPGSTTCFDDPIKGFFMNGWMELKIALSIHGPMKENYKDYVKYSEAQSY